MTDLTSPARPLPGFLVDRYRGWRATTYEDNKSWYRRLATDGQRPPLMVIACCDSRVNVNAIFGTQTGDIFLHRNIANAVPEHAPDTNAHGTSAAVEYAVKALRVSHLAVIGHSQCGGVRGCHDMCAGHAPELQEETSYLGRWLETLRPGFDQVKDIEDTEARISAMERAAIGVSLRNLMTFPFIRDAVAQDELSLHGLFFDIGAGLLEELDGKTGQFNAL